MKITWTKNNKPIVTLRAYGFYIEGKIMWIPKSQVTIPDENENMAEIPDWLYDKKIEEMYL